MTGRAVRRRSGVEAEGLPGGPGDSGSVGVRLGASLRWIRSSPMAISSLCVIAIYVLIAIAAPILWGHRAVNADPAALLEGPSSAHWLGTDNLGRDTLLRTLVATRLSLEMAVSATLIAAILGLLLGAAPAVLGRRVQRMVAALINGWLAFPVLLVAMLIVILLGSGGSTEMVALIVTMIPSFARLAQTLSARVGGSEYLAAAQMLGLSRSRQLRRHVLPNIAEPVIVNVTISIGGALLALSSLSFLGIGVQAPQFDWGSLLSQGFNVAYQNPTAVLGPAVAVVLIGAAFGMLGEAYAAHVRMRDHGVANKARLDLLGALPERVERVSSKTTDTHATDADRSAADGADGDSPSQVRPLLDVVGLSVSLPSAIGWVHATQDVSLRVMSHEIVGLVGESGSGKSVTMMAVAQLSSTGAVVRADRLQFAGEDVVRLGKRQRRRLLTKIGVVFQDSQTALNPAMRVGSQLAEVPRIQRGASHRQARREGVESLNRVAIDDPDRRAGQFPHELSGGMRQRVLIAMSQLGRPSLLIADEPTTALDVTVQKRVLSLLRQECDETGAAAIVVSHDIAVIAELCERALVMYAGRIVEDVPAASLADPNCLAHPYTRALVSALPSLDHDRSQPLPIIAGEPPDLSSEIAGCAFAPRCPIASERCTSEVPALTTSANGGAVACWHPFHGQPDHDSESARRAVSESR